MMVRWLSMQRLVKRLALSVTLLAGLALLALLALHHDGAIETDVLIDSPPDAVWKVLTATADYPVWNPEITRLSGSLREGNVIEFVEGTGSDAMVFHPELLAVRFARELRWKGSVWLPGIFDGEHYFLLEPVGNQTRFIQGETFSGILAGRLTQGVLQDTVDSMQVMNRALKQRAEAFASPEPH